MDLFTDSTTLLLVRSNQLRRSKTSVETKEGIILEQNTYCHPIEGLGATELSRRRLMQPVTEIESNN